MGRHKKLRLEPEKKPHPKQRLDVVDTRAVERALCSRHFREFLPEAFEVMEGGDAHAALVRAGRRPPRFIPGWHIDAMADHLQAVADGEIRRLLINVPPGCMKSATACVLWPAWLWARDATLRFLFSSYSEEFTKRDCRKTKALLNSEWYRELFPDVKLKRDPDTAMEHHTTAGGERHGASTNSGVTGKHVHGIVEDDPLKAQDARSPRAREDAWEYRTQTLGFRLLPEAGWRVVIMQRLHEDDPSGRILARAGRDTEEDTDEYVHLCLPMEYEPSRRCSTVLFDDPRKVEGDLLWPARMDRRYVDALKSPQGLGAYGWAGQGQQRPSPAEGGIIKRAWWRYYRERPTEFERLLISWDLIFKQSGSSWVVGQVWGRKGPDAFLLDQLRDKLDFPGQLNAVRGFKEKWPDAKEILIEDAANGPAVVSVVKKEIPGVIPVPARGSKESRLAAIATFVEAGNVWLPDPTIAPWVEGFVEEVAMFPNGANDDQCDCASQGLNRIFSGPKKATGAFNLGRAGERPSPWGL
ncbi:MAG TPA: phage terminase large subunit [Gammaproteobacteria bacterium]|nr:phage terminase large subunit [Gammaproteobacteria bacterium]